MLAALFSQVLADKAFAINTEKILTADEIAAAQAQAATEALAARLKQQAADEAVALREKIAKKNADLQAIQNEIDTYQKWLNSARNESMTLKGAIQELDMERQKMGANINKTQNRIDSTNLNVEELSIEITNTEDHIKKSTESIAAVLRAVDQADQQSFVEMILSEDNLSGILDEKMQLIELGDKVNERVKELQKNKTTLTEQKGEQEAAVKKLANYKTSLADQKAILDSTERQKTAVLKATKNREADYQKILEENRQKKIQFENDLAAYEGQLTRQLSMDELPPATHDLLWPVDVPVVTQRFGITSDSGQLYASGSHNGMDLRASVGTPISSPAHGVVIGVGDTDVVCPKASYGKWVLVRLDMKLTVLFAHFSMVKVSQGQEVDAGDLLGYSGNTGYSTGPHLHIGMFASGGVKVGAFASQSCAGRTFTMPLPTVKPPYLDPSLYFPQL